MHPWRRCRTTKSRRTTIWRTRVQVPEPSVTDQLNAQSLMAAQKGQAFNPPAPGQDYNAKAGQKM